MCVCACVCVCAPVVPRIVKIFRVIFGNLNQNLDVSSHLQSSHLQGCPENDLKSRVGFGATGYISSIFRKWPSKADEATHSRFVFIYINVVLLRDT